MSLPDPRRKIRHSDYPTKHIVFDGPAVRERLMRIVEDEDLKKYIL